MRLKNFFLSTVTTGLAAALLQGGPNAPTAFAAQNAAALAGQVTSADEGAMEGVIVSARKDGSTITVSVVSDKQGRYGFPAGQARARPLYARDPRGRLRPRRRPRRPT